MELKKTLISYEESLRLFAGGGTTWPGLQISDTRRYTLDERANEKPADIEGRIGQVDAISKQLSELSLLVKRGRRGYTNRGGPCLRHRGDVPTGDYCGRIGQDSASCFRSNARRGPQRYANTVTDRGTHEEMGALLRKMTRVFQRHITETRRRHAIARTGCT